MPCEIGDAGLIALYRKKQIQSYGQTSDKDGMISADHVCTVKYIAAVSIRDRSDPMAFHPRQISTPAGDILYYLRRFLSFRGLVFSSAGIRDINDLETEPFCP